LKKDKYKVLTFTHGKHFTYITRGFQEFADEAELLVDTSTGVLSNAKMIAETVKEVSPETLVSTFSSSPRP